ncbi:hypothetical protein SKAU_G00080250 [Synaphobranchus kaupii]|uniref:Uncharacterized protein n=1 Tax=Synaphobranchus kaupii TaxID=118154 RepID=A0A9Q1J4E4_SYNKA|nr:hypothetical protein SKAU_G00080250 [Synaphobranchus kaupii]
MHCHGNRAVGVCYTKSKKAQRSVSRPRLPSTMSSRLADQHSGVQYCRHFLADNSVFHVGKVMYCCRQSGPRLLSETVR